MFLTPVYSCHGVFIDRFIFRSNFPGKRLPWECHDPMTNHKKLIDVTTWLDRNCLAFAKENYTKIEYKNRRFIFLGLHEKYFSSCQVRILQISVSPNIFSLSEGKCFYFMNSTRRTSGFYHFSFINWGLSLHIAFFPSYESLGNGPVLKFKGNFPYTSKF